jgi:cytochrome c oxidase subunit 1
MTHPLKFLFGGLLGFALAVPAGIMQADLGLNRILFWCHLVGGIGMGAFMGMAGLQGMLRRTLYFEGEFRIYMILAALAGALLLVGFLAFFVNIVMTVGLRGVLGIFAPSKLKTKDLLPAGS